MASKAFLKLEDDPSINEEDRKEYQKLAFQIFLRYVIKKKNKKNTNVLLFFFSFTFFFVRCYRKLDLLHSFLFSFSLTL
jgi:hypothetical protein